MKQRVLYILTAALCLCAATLTAHAQTETKGRVVNASVKCVVSQGDIIISFQETEPAASNTVSQSRDAITLNAHVSCGVSKRRVRNFIMQTTRKKVVTIRTFPSRLIEPLGDIILPDGRKLSDLVTARFPG